MEGGEATTSPMDKPNLATQVESLVRKHKDSPDFSYLVRAYDSLWWAVREILGPRDAIATLFEDPEKVTSKTAADIIQDVYFEPFGPPKDAEKAILALAKVLRTHKFIPQHRTHRLTMVMMWCIEWANGLVTDDKAAVKIAQRTYEGAITNDDGTTAHVPNIPRLPNRPCKIVSLPHLFEKLALMAWSTRQSRDKHVRELSKDVYDFFPEAAMFPGVAEGSPIMPLQDILRRSDEAGDDQEVNECLAMIVQNMFISRQSYFCEAVEKYDEVIKATAVLYHYVKDLLVAGEQGGKKSGHKGKSNSGAKGGKA